MDFLRSTQNLKKIFLRNLMVLISVKFYWKIFNFACFSESLNFKVNSDRTVKVAITQLSNQKIWIKVCNEGAPECMGKCRIDRIKFWLPFNLSFLTIHMIPNNFSIQYPYLVFGHSETPVIKELKNLKN